MGFDSYKKHPLFKSNLVENVFEIISVSTGQAVHGET